MIVNFIEIVVPISVGAKTVQAQMFVNTENGEIEIKTQDFQTANKLVEMMWDYPSMKMRVTGSTIEEKK